MPKLEEKSKKKLDKSIFLILIMVILIVAIVFFAIKYGFSKGEEVKISAWQRPLFLDLSLPSIESVQQAINNPLLQELEYHEKYFAPITPGAKGRPNPFAPF